jgi:beta-N-acetylhexosaminidase
MPAGRVPSAGVTAASRRRRLRTSLSPVVAAALLTGLAGCASGQGTGAVSPSSSSAPAPTPVPTPTASPTPTTAPSSPSPTPSATGSPTRGTTSSPAAPPAAAGADTRCARAVASRLTEAQRVGQLLMVGFDTAAARTSLDGTIAGSHVGGVVYLGGWTGAEGVRATSRHLQGRATEAATGGVGLLVAADQEGGQVQQLRGAGFTRIPPALTQGSWAPATLQARATGWARELAAVGVNVNLAPVADTVPAAIGRANEPIGRYGRQFGDTPAEVSRSSVAFLRGMRAGEVEGTLKHFPGLGRIRANTDFSATGITDSVATVDDPHLQPFRAGIRAGAGLVMVGSARYPKLDPDNRAMFSPSIVTGLLRERLGFDGVVVTDDVNARAVRDVPAGERAVRVLRAGGDVVLDGNPRDAAAMARAIRAEADRDPRFAAQVDASVERVLALKARMGLVRCGG